MFDQHAHMHLASKPMHKTILQAIDFMNAIQCDASQGLHSYASMVPHVHAVCATKRRHELVCARGCARAGADTRADQIGTSSQVHLYVCGDCSGALAYASTTCGITSANGINNETLYHRQVCVYTAETQEQMICVVELLPAADLAVATSREELVLSVGLN
jgi:hypothetical protein